MEYKSVPWSESAASIEEKENKSIIAVSMVGSSPSPFNTWQEAEKMMNKVFRALLSVATGRALVSNDCRQLRRELSPSPSGWVALRLRVPPVTPPKEEGKKEEVLKEGAEEEEDPVSVGFARLREWLGGDFVTVSEEDWRQLTEVLRDHARKMGVRESVLSALPSVHLRLTRGVVMQALGGSPESEASSGPRDFSLEAHAPPPASLSSASAASAAGTVGDRVRGFLESKRGNGGQA